MQHRLLALFGAAALAVASAAADAAPAVQELPIPGLTAQGSKMYRDDSGLLPSLPDANEVTEPQAGPSAPRAVYRTGCIFRPYGSVTYTITARGRVFYRVVPQRFFDVTLRVTYVNLRSFYADRFFAGGAESLLIQGPFAPKTVRVTIGGYRGSYGCFALSITP